MKKIHKISQFFFTIFLISVTVTPILSKHLLMLVYFPGLNEKFYAINTPFYWLIFISQTFLSHFVLISLQFYICVILTFICFGTNMIKILKLKVKALGIVEKSIGKQFEMKVVEIDKEKDLKADIVTCIKMHLQIKQYVADF